MSVRSAVVASAMGVLAMAVLALALLALGCGASGSPETIRIHTEVHIVRGESRERLGVAPEQARVAAAASSLEKSLGHPLAIEVDAALTPPSSDDVVVQTANSLESLARYFAEQSRLDPLLYAFLREKLARVAARYRASAEFAAATFEDSTGTLVFTMREARGRGWLADSIELESALEDAHARYLSARFARTGAAAVADGDLDAYFRWLATRRGPSSKSESVDDRADRVLGLLLFESRARGKSIHAEVEQYLADQAAWLLDEETQGPPRARLRAAYARWVDEQFFAMKNHPRSVVYERLLGRVECPTDPCPRFPELDRVKLALGFFEHSAPEGEESFGAFDQALCLYEEANSKIERRRSCASVYPFLTENDARADRLAAVLAKTRRRDFLIAALASAHLSRLLGALERQGGTLHADALRILVDVDFYGFRDATYVLRAEVKRLWVRRADLRPLLLRLIVEDYLKSGLRDESFAALPREYPPFDAQLFARFLDEGPRSVELAPALWPALRTVAAPFEILAPRLATYIEKHAMDGAKTVAALVRRACEANDLEGLRVIRVVLQKRAKTGDKDSIVLALAARDCKPAHEP